MPLKTKLTMNLVNHNVRCQLCTGYLVDATTIIECLHSFCRSCIVRYLESSKYCPICDVQVHKTRPLLNIRSDKTLQALVYKIVPGLFKNEMQRRKEFYEKNPQPVSEGTLSLLSKEEKGDMGGALIFTADEKFSVCIQHTMSEPPYQNRSCGSMPTMEEGPGDHQRHLLCPANFTIGLLKKFILGKYGLGPNFRVGVIHSDVVLDENLTLIDIAYIYCWHRQVPLKLFYVIIDVNLLPKPQMLPAPSPEKEAEIVMEKKDGEMEKEEKKGEMEVVKSSGSLKMRIKSHTNGSVKINGIEASVVIENGPGTGDTSSVRVKQTDSVEVKSKPKDSGIAAVVEVPKDDSDKNHVEISVSEVSEDCSEQAMDLSVPQKRGELSVPQRKGDTDGEESVVSISSSSPSMDTIDLSDTDSMEIGATEIEEEVQREIRGYQKPKSVASTSKSTKLSLKYTKALKSSAKGKTNDSNDDKSDKSDSSQAAKSSLLDKPKDDDSLQNTINNILEVLGTDNSKSDDEQKSDKETKDKMDTSVESVSELNGQVESEDTSEPMDTTEKPSDQTAKKSTANKISDNDPNKSSDSLQNLVIIEPEKYPGERCESVHSDKENQRVSPTIVDIVPVNSNLPKVEKIADKFTDKLQEKDTQLKDTKELVEENANQCSVVVPPTQLPQPIYTVQSFQPPMVPAPTKPLSMMKATKLGNSPGDVKKTPQRVDMDGIVKRKRGRPPKVPKDPSQCTPPKIAKILPKGMPPQQNMGFYSNGLMPQQGQYPHMQFPMYPTMNQMNQTLPNGQAVRIFVQNVQNMAAGQAGGQMMVNGQPMNLTPQQQQGLNQQFMGQQMVNGQAMMNPQFLSAQQQQQQQQQIPNSMNMNMLNMNNQMQMMNSMNSSMNGMNPPTSSSPMTNSHTNSSGVMQESTNSSSQNTPSTSNSTTTTSTDSKVNISSNMQLPVVSTAGQVPGGMINMSQFNPQMQGQPINQQMAGQLAGRQMMQPMMAGAMPVFPQMTTNSGSPQGIAHTGAHHNLPISQPPTSRPTTSQGFNANSKMAQLLSQPLQNSPSRMMMYPANNNRQPGYPPAPKLPSLPNMKGGSVGQNKPMKVEKPTTNNSTTTKSSSSSSSSSNSTGLNLSKTDSDTGLNNGYDAPLELTTKKETAALEKLSAMQPPIASS